MVRRKKIALIANHIPKKEFTILIGPRQVGKSTMLLQLHEDLKAKSEITYFLNLDRKTILDDLNESPENLFKTCPLQQGKRIIVFIDEIQYLDDATTFLKLLYDEYATQLKIVATGSSEFYIDKQFNDSLAGRKRIFQMGTLDFEEFLLFKNKKKLIKELALIKNKTKSVYENELWALMDEFINYGGYPAVVLEKNIDVKIELLKDIRDSYIKRDVLESGVFDQGKFFRMLLLLASQSGNLLNVNELSNTLRITNATVENYLYILQKCFHITLVKPFYNNLRKELTKMPRIYINDLGLRNVLINYFSPLEQRADKGQVLENFAFRLLNEKYDENQLKYWRTADGNEVDFVVETSFMKGFAVEVKFNSQEAKTSKYKKFVENYPTFPLEFWSWKDTDLLTN